MSIATLDQVISFDDEGTIVGLQFDGRDRAIQEYMDRKEQQEFDALCNRLYQRNWAREARKDPERLDAIRESQRRHRESGRKQERTNERRREKYAADPVVNVCEECGKSETVPFDKVGPKHSRFCGKKCRNRWHGKRRKRAKGQRQMDIRARVFEFLRDNGPATSRAIADAVDGKLHSVRTCLHLWVKAGDLQSDGKRPAVFWV